MLVKQGDPRIGKLVCNWCRGEGLLERIDFKAISGSSRKICPACSGSGIAEEHYK